MKHFELARELKQLWNMSVLWYQLKLARLERSQKVWLGGLEELKIRG